MRWSVWSVAALTVGFWSQVILWHGWLHPQRREPTAMPLDETSMPVSVVVTDGQVRALVEGLKGRLDPALFPSGGRVEVRVEVGPDGRAGRMGIDSTPEMEPRAQRRLQRAIKRIQFPRSTDAYRIEFPIVFQRVN